MAVNEIAGYGQFTRTPEQLDEEILYSMNEGYLRKGGVVRSGEGVLVAGTLLAYDSQSGKYLRYDDTAAVNEVQTLDFGGTVTGGTFTVTYRGQTTAALAYNISNANLQTALEGLSTIGVGNILVGGGPAPTDVTLTFRNALGSADQPLMTANGAALTGTAPTLTVVQTTAGVAGGAAAVGVLARGIDTGTDVNGGGDQHVDIYFTGVFKTAKLVGLDANAITDLGAKQNTVLGYTRIP